MKIEKQIKRLGLGAQEIRKRLPGHQPGIYYVVPKANWSIDWDGHYITKGVREQFGVRAQLTDQPRWLSGQILHYGSLWSYLGNRNQPHNQRNRIALTVFHGSRESDNSEMAEAFNQLLASQDEIDALIVSNRIMEARFLAWGFPAERLHCIPLGVDLSVFKPARQKEKELIRKKLGIANEAFCIGSFQKDGEGWEEGLQPKLVKGPDLFIQAIASLKKQHQLHVLLTGPARGYVKRELDNLGVPYTHHLLDDYEEIVDYYAALDAYMVSSREEGGPKGVLESLACGIPLVTSIVGLAPDVIKDGKTGLLAESGDAEGLAQAMDRLINNEDLRKGLSEAGFQRIQEFDWKLIARQYYEMAYKPLMKASI